jgi:hypothetical protein
MARVTPTVRSSSARRSNALKKFLGTVRRGFWHIAALNLKLTPEEMKSLEEPYVPHPVLGHS